MSIFSFEEQIDSPLLPERHLDRTKLQLYNIKKLAEFTPSKSYKSTTNNTNSTCNLELFMQSPLRKRKIIKPQSLFVKNKNKSKSKDNKSLIHGSEVVVREEKKARPQSSTFTAPLRKRQSINVQDNAFSKTPSKILYTKPFMPPIGMTAYSYIIMQNDYVHLSWNSKTMVQIASLTKIMTCYCILNILKNYNLDKNEVIEVGIVETSVIGTSARLKRNYRYTVHQLLYGLMLPSGNDASMALAVWGGRTLAAKGWKVAVDVIKKRQAISLFVDYMNSVAREIELKKTKFSNPHGLSSPDNKSTAYDISLLSNKAMKNHQFRKIVGVKEFSTQVITDRGEREETVWKNTHKLLKKDCYLGVKTGITTTAGACLSSFITINHRDFVIVVLNCKKQSRRFKQTQILRKWLYKKQQLCKAQKSIDLDFQLQLQEIEDNKDIIN